MAKRRSQQPRETRRQEGSQGPQPKARPEKQKAAGISNRPAEEEEQRQEKVIASEQARK